MTNPTPAARPGVAPSAERMASFEALYAEYGDRIYRFCFRLSGRRADAEDVAQEVFLAAFQGLGGFQGRSTVLTWLYRIALYRWRKMRGALGPGTISLPEHCCAGGEADPAQVSLARMSLDRALAALPEDLREAFLLVKAEGLKYREAADALGVPLGTVQSRVHDAAHRLRALLGEDAPEGRTSPQTGEGTDHGL